MAKRESFRGRKKQPDPPLEHNLDLMLEHARLCWQAEETNAARAAVERRILASATVAAIGFVIVKLPLSGGGVASNWSMWLGIVSLIFFAAAIQSILSLKVALPSPIMRRIVACLRGVKCDFGRNWGQAGRRERVRGWLWAKARFWFRPPPYRPPSASWYLRFQVPDDELWELASDHEGVAKASVFASVYNAFLKLQARTAQDLRGVRAGTFRFSMGIIFVVAAAIFSVIDGPNGADKGSRHEQAAEQTSTGDRNAPGSKAIQGDRGAHDSEDHSGGSLRPVQGDGPTD